MPGPLPCCFTTRHWAQNDPIQMAPVYLWASFPQAFFKHPLQQYQRQISLSQRRPVIITVATEGRCQWVENCLQGWLQQCDKMQPSLWSNYNAVQKQCSDSFLLWVNKNNTRLRKEKYVSKIDIKWRELKKEIFTYSHYNSIIIKI